MPQDNTTPTAGHPDHSGPAAEVGTPERAVTVYGADWCGDCRRAKRVLDQVGARYTWIDVAADPEAAQEALAISGRRNIPVIVMPDGGHLVEPSNPELLVALVEHGVVTA